MVSQATGTQQKTVSRPLTIHPWGCAGGCWFTVAIYQEPHGISKTYIQTLFWGTKPVTEHLSAQGRLNPRGALHCFWCPNKINNRQNWHRIEKLMAPQNRWVKNSKKQTTKHYKSCGSQTPKKFLVYCSVVIRVLE